MVVRLQRERYCCWRCWRRFAILVAVAIELSPAAARTIVLAAAAFVFGAFRGECTVPLVFEAAAVAGFPVVAPPI